MKDKKKLNAPVYRLLEGANKSALRTIWHQAKSHPHTPEENLAHNRRRQRILNRVSELQKTKITPIWKRKKHIAVAAITLVCFSVGYFLYYQSNPTTDHYNVTSSASSRDIILPDSTAITLAPYSSLSWQQVERNFDRKVFLRGKATFAVTRKMHQNFTVKTSNIGVQVLGTIFTVDDSDTNKEQKVTVQEGKVAVSITSSVNPQSYTLLAGQQLINNNGSAQIISEPRSKSHKGIKQIKLEGATLGQLAEQLAQVYEIEVYVTPAIRSTGALTAEFEDMELDQVLRLISRTIEINYRIQSKKVYISQKK